MNTLAPAAVPLQAKIDALNDPSTYPDSTSCIKAIETHCAWVFLTDAYAYKLKKPMRLDRMDNLLLSSRRHNCLEELRLNRRLAPGTYLDVVALRLARAGGLSLRGGDEPVEWLVKMRRLRSDLLLDRALDSGNVSATSIRSVAELLARFYRAQPSVPMTGIEYLRRIERAVELNGHALRQAELALPGASVAAAIAPQREFLGDRSNLLEARADAGRIIEGHGDLKPEHIYLGVPPCVIDCLEFDRDLRILDPLEELAFLSLECERLGASWIGREMIDVYLAESADHFDLALFDFYVRRRATQRSLTAAWHLRDPSVCASKDWRRLALVYLDRVSAGRFASERS